MMEELSYSEMIDLLLDGELLPERRSELFARLAIDEQLQAEFQQALTIRIAALSEAQQLVPPPELATHILAAASQQAPSLWHSLWQSSLVKAVAIGMTSLGIGYFAGQLSLGSRAPHTPPPQPAAAATTQSSAPEQSAPPAVHASLLHTHPLHSSTTPHSTSPALLTSALPQPVTTTATLRMQHAPTITPTGAEMPSPTREPDAERSSDVVVSIRRSVNIALRQHNLVQPVSNPLANTIATIERREGSVGIFVDIGYEHFPLYEISTSSGSSQLTLHQLLPWVAGGMRVYLPPIVQSSTGASLQPIVGIALGSSQYGVLGRGQLGLQWEVAPHLSIQALLEGMVHSHGIGSRWEHAEKLSASMGLSFRF